MIFPGKPAAEERDKLKSYGFRWSPTEGAWQRHLSNAAKYAAETIAKELPAPTCPYCRRQDCETNPCSTELQRRATPA
jgi:hypothetical protein